MGPAPDGTLSPIPHFYEIKGRAAEIARALGSPVGGAEHLFLAMLHDGGWPVSVVAHLVDPGQAEEAVLAILSDPGYSPPSPPRFYVPAGYVHLWGAELAVLETKDAPAGQAPEGAVIRPEGLAMDSPLTRAIADALPDGTTFGFNSGEDERTWVLVIGPGGSLGPTVTREVLNTALASLSRPALDG
jgi:hypothetical protein